jgi:uncharacterized protein YndB with AHSA1/START domain
MTTATRRGPRAIADVSQGIILADVEIAATPERVFAALTRSDEVPRWWGSDEAYHTTAWSADVRVGGKWRAEGRGADGKPFTVAGEFREVDPPRRLVFTWKPDWDTAVTTVSYLLEPVGDGTRLTLRHDGFAGRVEALRGHTQGWELVLGWLGEHVRPAAAAATADRFYLCRLIAPRPTFPFDMSADERAMMTEHVAYWTANLKAGKAVVFGPVADPSGPWGLGVVRVKDEAELKELQARDPAVRGERGLRYETLPMLRAVVRE